MKKTLFSLLTVIILVFTLVACQSTSAPTDEPTDVKPSDTSPPTSPSKPTGPAEHEMIVTEGSFVFCYRNSRYILKAYKGIEETVTVPETCNGLPVTCIGALSFASNTSVKEVILPDSVTSIEDSAFMGCAHLESIRLSSKLSNIGVRAFANCLSLKAVELPAETFSIGDYAFFNCGMLKAVELPTKMIKYGKYVFAECKELESVTIPYTMTYVPEGMFNKCTSLKSVTFPNTVEKISKCAFMDCTSLEAVDFKSKLTVIEEQAFSDCKALTELVIPEGVKELGARAFAACSSISSLSLPSTLETIPNECFVDCSSLKNATLSEGIEFIQTSAFSSCTSLAEITLPSTLKRIGSLCFADCTSLLEITIPSGPAHIDNGTFLNCTALKRVSLPQGISKIHNYTFSGCTELEEINLPSSIIVIEEDAFSSCDKLFKKENGIYYVDNWAVGCDNTAPRDLRIKSGTVGIALQHLGSPDETRVYPESVIIPDSVKHVTSTCYAKKLVYMGTQEGLDLLKRSSPDFFDRAIVINRIDFHIPDDFNLFLSTQFVMSPTVLYSEASTEGEALCTLKLGTPLSVMGISSDDQWLFLSCEDADGTVTAGYAKSEPISNLREPNKSSFVFINDLSGSDGFKVYSSPGYLTGPNGEEDYNLLENIKLGVYSLQKGHSVKIIEVDEDSGWVHIQYTVKRNTDDQLIAESGYCEMKYLLPYVVYV